MGGDTVRLNIVTGPEPHQLVSLAASELGHIVNRLFGLTPTISEAPVSDTDARIELVGEAPDDNQAFVLRRTQIDGTPGLTAVGGSPQATLWAVYELAEQWGVRFLLTEDIYPDSPGAFHLPEVDKTWTPWVRTRAWRIFNCLPHSGSYWGADDYEKLFRQLAKQKYNRIFGFFRTYDAFTDYTFDGVRKRTAEISRGLRFPIHDGTIGRELFGDVNSFYNPDLPVEPDTVYEADPDTTPVNEERIAAGKRHVETVIERCHALGMDFAAGFWYTEFPQEMKKQLKRASDRHGFKPTPFKGEYLGLRIGVLREGIVPEYAPYMTPMNPDFVDLVDAVARSYVERFPAVDYYVFSRVEFPAGPLDAETCWQHLSRRYGLDASLEDLVAEAVETGDVDAHRCELDLCGDICQLYLLDELLNQRRIIAGSANPDAVAVIQVGTVLGRFVPRMFSNVELLASLGYTTESQADRGKVMQFAEDGNIKAQLVISLEDDNIGESPQYNAASIARLYQVIDDYQLDGYYGRQWLISKVDPAAFYMARANWDRNVTVEETYLDLVTNVCGADAVDATLAAFALGERVTLQKAANSFLVPSMVSNQFDLAEPVPESWSENIRMYEQMTTHFDQALVVSREAGKPFLERLRHQAQFAVYWHRAITDVRRAGKLRQQADKARDEAQDVESYDQLNIEVVALLDRALTDMRLATEAYARSAGDRADLGVVVALNVYGLEILDAIRKLEFIKMTWWTADGKA